MDSTLGIISILLFCLPIGDLGQLRNISSCRTSDFQNNPCHSIQLSSFGIVLVWFHWVFELQHNLFRPQKELCGPLHISYLISYNWYFQRTEETVYFTLAHWKTEYCIFSLGKVTWQYLYILSRNRMREDTWTMFVLLAGYMEKTFSTNLKEQRFIRCAKLENHNCFIIKVHLHNQRRQAWLRGFLAKWFYLPWGSAQEHGVPPQEMLVITTRLSICLYPFKLCFSPAFSIRSM